MPAIPFGQWYVSESLPISAQELVNFYINIPQTQTITTASLFATPGLVSVATAGTDEFGRGAHVFNGIPYFVNGTNLYRLDRTYDVFGDPVYTPVQVNGAVPIPGSGRVIMSDNGVKGGQMCIVVPALATKFNAYIYDGATLAAISDANFDGPASGVVYIDGYFLFTKSDGNKFFISNLRDGLTYTALDFSDAETDPDPISAPFVLAGELFIFGSQTIQAFQNVGGADFPFASIEGSVLEKGLDAPFSLIELNGAMVWIGASVNEQPAIWMSNGGEPVKISTTAIDNELRKYTDTQISTAFAIKYSQSGATFACFTIPGQKSFVFDSVTASWHARESRGITKSEYRVSHIVDAYNELIINDLFSNNIGLIDRETFTEFGEEMRRRFVLPPVDNEGQPFFVDAVEAVGGAGKGLVDGLEPMILLSTSEDGGNNFNEPLDASFGAIGDYTQRPIWTQVGRFERDVMFKFEVSAPIKWSFTKIEVEFD
jgi:hypothetical protein